MPAGAAPGLLETLDDLGVGVAGFEDESPQPAAALWTIEILHQSEPDRAELTTAINRLVRQLGLPPVELDISAVPHADWLAAVGAQFPPQRVGRFWIHGSHEEAAAPPGLIPIKLDAGLAFGSGEHATTRGCLAALDALARRRRFRRVLDLGCGSGILAIAAAKCWPARVVAADNDPSAVEVARGNVRENEVAANLRVVRSDGLESAIVRAAGPYDLILANILAEPLIELARALARVLSANGALVLSGLLIEQVDAVAAACRAHGLRPVRLIEDGPWATLQLRRLREPGRPSRRRVRASSRPARRERPEHGPGSARVRPRRRSLRRR